MAANQNQKEYWLQQAQDASILLGRTTRSTLSEVVQTFNSLNLGSVLIDADLTGTRWEGLTAADFVAACSSLQAFEAWIDAGHDDNLEKIIVGE
jgi:hypothetical protein